MVGHQLVEIDAGRFLHVIVVFESLTGFEARGLNGAHSFSDAVNAGISAMITDAHRQASQDVDRPDGLTLIVPAGIGRGFGYSLSEDLPQEWRVYAMPIHDLMTASWIERFEPLNLWRIDDELKALSALGVFLINQSGLLNLIGCTQELNGRIFAEDAFSDFSSPSEGPKVVLLATNAHRMARREAHERYGARRALDVEGRWRRLQKFGTSPFEGDNSDTIYASRESIEEGDLLGACLTKTRAWWLGLLSPKTHRSACSLNTGVPCACGFHSPPRSWTRAIHNCGAGRSISCSHLMRLRTRESACPARETKTRHAS